MRTTACQPLRVTLPDGREIETSDSYKLKCNFNNKIIDVEVYALDISEGIILGDDFCSQV